MEAVDANMAAKADDTFCLETSKVIWRHCTDAYRDQEQTKRIGYNIQLVQEAVVELNLYEDQI